MHAQSNPVPASQGTTANKRGIGWLVGLTSVFAVLGVGLAVFLSQRLWGYPFWRPGLAREIAEATALTHLTILDPSNDKDCNFAKPGSRAIVSILDSDSDFQNEARLLATLEARGLAVSVTSPDAGLDGSALYRQLIEADRLKPVSNEKPCLWGVALEVANASGVRTLVVGAHRFFAGTDTYQYYESVFNLREDGKWRFARERHYQYDVAGMEGILEWPTMHAVLAVAGLVAGAGLWLAGLLVAKLVGFVRRRKAAPVF